MWSCSEFARRTLRRVQVSVRFYGDDEMRRTELETVLTLIAGVCWLGMATAVNAAVIYVDASATGSDDGSSWNDAFNDLQDALNAASQGDEIWVATGTYMPDGGYIPVGGSHVPGTGNRIATFQLKKGVDLFGGFDGTESLRSERVFAKCDGGDYDGLPCADDDDCGSSISCAGNKTTLSGDLDDDDTNNSCTEHSDCNPGANEFCLGGYCVDSDNAEHVVVYDVDDINGGFVLDGFIVERGRAVDDEHFPPQGPGVHIRAIGENAPPCLSSQSTLRNCVFRHNYAVHHGAVNDHASDTTIENSLFKENYASASNSEGAALNIHSGSPTITDCVFVGNVGGGSGGAVWAGHDGDASCTDGNADSEPSFSGCRFENNSATAGGAIFSTQAVPVIDRCVFDGNSATGGTQRTGGAIWLGHTSGEVTAVIANTLFTRNRAIGPNIGIGGALYLPLPQEPSQVSLVVDSCRFVGNTASDFGGAIYQGGYVEYINTEFVGNEAVGGQFAGRGGAVVVAGNLGSKAWLINCTLAGNRGESLGGGVVVVNGSSIEEASNCIFWGNELFDETTETIETTETAQIYNGGTATVEYSIIHGLEAMGEFDNGTNIDADPLFVRDPEDCDDDGWGDPPCTSGCGTGCDDYGDLRLTSGSPAIDAGDNDAIYGYDTDLDGNDRRINDVNTPDTGAPADDCPYVDMGAYEYDGDPGCCDDSDCSTGEVCCDSVCESGDCCGDSDCAGNDICCNNSCESWGCCDDSDCGFGLICCPGINVCKSELICAF
jgi:predicted outer membrane repeat protein